MANVVFPSFQFNDTDCDAQPGSARDDTIFRRKDDPWFEMGESGFMDLFPSVFGQENRLENKAELVGNASDDWMEHGFCNQIMNFEPVQPQKSGFSRSLKEKQSPYSLASWDLLNNYGKRFRMPSEENWTGMSNVGERRLTTEEILMAAGERFIQFSTNRVDGISMFIHPYSTSLSGLPIDDARDVELVHFLLAAAENVGIQQFDLASQLVSRCLWTASDSGSPVQRVVFYFAEALKEKINRNFGMIKNDKKMEFEKKQHKGLALGSSDTFLATHQELPFAQVVQFAGIQAIIENVNAARKIHLIDLQIRSGIHWTALMQGLVECSIKRLKITAVGTVDQLYMEETGKRLRSFAQSLNLPFSFKAVYLTDMGAFREDVLNIEADETVAVYSFMMLRSMISKPDLLENLMKAMTRIKPALFVVIEVEANHNSPSFIDRFIEALLFYSAYFDCLEDCMDRNNNYRSILEGTYFGEGIMNIVAADDQERVTRNVKLDVWKAFFTRFGMIETELSESSRYQASLVLKKFAKGSSCNLEFDGKGLIVGWKGTPIQSLTAWKFS